LLLLSDEEDLGIGMVTLSSPPTFPGIKSTNASAGATAGYRIYLKTVEYTDSEAKALLYAKTYED